MPQLLLMLEETKQNLEAVEIVERHCEPLSEPLPRPESRLKTIADIGKERLRNAVAKLAEESKGQQKLVMLSPKGGANA